MNTIRRGLLFISLFTPLLLFGCGSSGSGEATVLDADLPAVSVTVPGAKAVPMHVQESIINWTGRKPLASHNGEISLKEGVLFVKGGEPVGGRFVMDMESIRNLDIADQERRTQLVSHLKSEDFFDTQAFPEGVFEITQLSKLSDDSNYKVSGNLTLKGITKPIVFESVIRNKEGVWVVWAELKIDRTKWGIRYASSSFFDNLKDKAISDDILVGLSLRTEK